MNQSRHPFTVRVVECVRSIPPGMVSTYGTVARMAGNAKSARQVARILHSLSRAENLPWHRVVNREGRISLPDHLGGDRQRRLLEDEGVRFDERGVVDLRTHLYPSK